MTDAIAQKYNGLVQGPYHAFVDTAIVRSLHYAAAAEAGRYLTTRQQESVHLLDIGVGVGSHLIRLIESLPDSVQEIRVTGIDLAEEALHQLDIKLRALPRPISYHPIVSSIDEIDPANVLQNGPVDVAVALLILHHLPSKQKIHALSLLKEITPKLLLLGEWNFDTEDSTETDNPEFQGRVERIFATIYDGISQDNTYGPPAIEGFLGPEREQILTFPTADRPKYMRPIGDWAAMLATFGFASTPVIIPPHEAPSGLTADKIAAVYGLLKASPK